MHRKYIIDGTVEFHPATSKLRDLGDTSNVVVLNSPAGRCLLLLIERAGKVVTQQEFMDIVWHQCGMIVSANTYYQNVCILRKGLKKIGFKYDPVVTIPRMGLTLSSDTQITIAEVKSSLSPTHSLEKTAMETELTTFSAPEDDFQPDCEANIATEDICQPMVTDRIGEENRDGCYTEDPLCEKKITAKKPLFNAIDENKTVVPIKKTLGVYAQAFLFTMLILLSGMTIFGMKNAPAVKHFDHYRLAHMEHGCRFFISKSSLVDGAREKALAYGKQFNNDCKKYPWIYINIYAMVPRAAVIRCTKPMTEKNHCISDYFLEDR